VRVNGQRITAASRAVRPGDVVTLALDRSVKILKVLGFSERREAFDSARLLYEDLTPPPAPADPAGLARDVGAGRPTKRQRRAIDRLHGKADI
jgi:ribosome-associated heat shock protein Hsp15